MIRYTVEKERMYTFLIWEMEQIQYMRAMTRKIVIV